MILIYYKLSIFKVNFYVDIFFKDLFCLEQVFFKNLFCSNVLKITLIFGILYVIFVDLLNTYTVK